MSEPVTKHRPSVDLDDFERRLREQAHPHDDDPLAELARLVGDRHDPYGDVFAREAVAAPAAYQSEHHDYQHGRQEPDFDYQSPVAPRLAGDFAAIEAGLRGTVSDHIEPTQQHPAVAAAALPFAQQGYYNEQAQADAYAAGQGYDEAEWAPIDRAVPQQAKSRRPVFIMAATIAVGVIGVGVAFALKGHSSSPGEVKTIMAAAGPTKIQPPADAPSDTTSQDSALLGKTNQPAPTRLANREEQPVDLAQTVQQNARDAASIPVPLSPSQQQDAMNANPGSAISDQGFNITPKKVKSISVRPDGTILPNDQPPAAAMPAPHAPKVAEHPTAPVAKASTPKTTSRVVLTTPKPTQTAETDTTPKPATTPKPVKKVKPQPQRVATAETPEQETTASVAPKGDTETAGGGGFAVQLAAPGSEAEAKSVSSKLGSKFASALSGHRLAFHKADSKGKSVYRVRVGSLSKEEAVGLCEKLKADGGSCFVAKN